jgi:Domain of unknown function (DUF5122) beta-propeller
VQRCRREPCTARVVPDDHPWDPRRPALGRARRACSMGRPVVAVVIAGVTALAAASAEARKERGLAGVLDPSFGNRGRVLTGVGRPTRAGADAVLVQRDGKIVAAGSAFAWTPIAEKPERFALVRYTSHGRLDQTFGHGGKVVTRVGNVRRRIGLEDSAISAVGPRSRRPHRRGWICGAACSRL